MVKTARRVNETDRAPAREPATMRLRWRGYRRAALADDLVAAVIVSILLLPQSLAYALLAGLSPIVGVMASLLPIVAYAAFGSSSTLAVGPVAVLAMMTAQAIGPVAQAHGVSAHLAALVLALEMAAIFLLAALLRLDVFAALLSAPVRHGFITGAAIVIAIGQLPPLLGVAVKGNNLAELLAGLMKAESVQPHAATAAIGLSALLALWAIRRFGVRLATVLGVPARPAQLLTRMAPMVVVVLAIAWIAGSPTQAQGVALAGRVDLRQGLSFPPLWQAPAALWLALLGPAALLGLVAYVESLAVAEALGARRGEKVQPRLELFGLAAANAAASVAGGMPVTGGFARSIVNFDAGARTRMAGVWTALFLAVAVLALGDVLRFLPQAVLAATIIVAVLSLVDFKPFGHAWRYSRLEFGLMLLVAALTVGVGVEEALLAGVLVATGLLLQRTARPHWAEVGRIPGTEVFRNVKRFEVETVPGVLSVRIDESLLFTNSRWLSETLGAAPKQRPGLRHVVLMMSGVNDIDFTGLEGLMHLARDLKAQQVDLHLSELKGPVSDRLEGAGSSAWLTGKVFRTQHDAQMALAVTR
jgi:sulfate permease, SulP family